MATRARRAACAASTGVPFQLAPALALKSRFFANSFLKAHSGPRPWAPSISAVTSRSTRKSRATKRVRCGAPASRASEMASGFIPSPLQARYAANVACAAGSAPRKKASKRSVSTARRSGTKRSA